MPLCLYDTLTKQKRLFKSLRDDYVRMYSCGPTVYDYDHLGHAWKYTVDDLLRRVLEYNGYKVRHVMNITDVGHLTSDADTGEDKVAKKAREEKKTAWEIAEFYTKVFFENRQHLNHLQPSIICKATDHIQEMIDLIKRLEEKGVTYKISDGIYFDLSKFPDYGKLSGNKPEELMAGARIEVNPEKRNPLDFALWKFSPTGQQRDMEWDSPWGKGFPGWHIECSAMSMKYLGPQLDIHTGGEDNIFPHHESEIAQSETAIGKQFVQFWVHTRHLKVEGEKMSKSKNNFFTVQNIIDKGFDRLALRYLFLTTHYRSSLNFTWDGLQASQNALEKIRSFLMRTRSDIDSGRINKNQIEKVENNFTKKFLEEINNDLNTPQALAVLWSLIKNSISNKEKILTLLKFDQVLGLNLKKFFDLIQKVPPRIEELLFERNEARKINNWQRADELRSQIENLGYIVEDTPHGTKLIPKP